MSDGSAYYSACDPCRARKFKCTKERPICTPCQQLGVDCKYSLKITRTALTRDNLNAAEQRIRDLETAFASLLPGIDLDAVLSSVSQDDPSDGGKRKPAGAQGRPTIKKEEDTSTPTPEPEAVPREADGFDWSESAVSLNDLADGMAALSVNPEGAGYLGATSHVVSLRALLGKDQGLDQASNTQSTWPPNFGLFSPSTAIMNLSEEVFVDAYFNHYHLTYPFIHEPTFRAQFYGTQSRPHGYSWSLLLNAVLALGAWCIGDDHSTIDDVFYQKSAQLSAENSAFESGNLAIVQALLLLSNYAQKRNRPNTGWNYLGLAVRMAMSLGLHKEFPNWEISALQREIRRRVWWGVYCFDAGASITFGRPVLLPEPGVMDVAEVANIHEEYLTTRSSTLSNHVESPTIYTSLIAQSQFHYTTNSIHHRLISHPEPSPKELLEMKSTINAWEKSVPPYFQGTSPQIEANFATFFARHRLSWRSWNLKIVLFRPVVLRWAARKWSTSISTAEIPEEIECRRQCLESARATIESVADFTAANVGSRLSNWYMLYFLFQAGLIPTICLMSDPMSDDASSWLNNVLTTKDLLSRTAVHNRLAARCLAVFERLCAPVFGVSQPEDVLQNPQIFDGSFDVYTNEQFNGMEFWDMSSTVSQWPT